jgi:thiol-disulfide isomerase/thioredoxin
MPAGRLVPALLAAVLGAALGGCAGADTGSAGGNGSARYVSGDGGITQVAVADRSPAPALAGRTLDGGRFDLADHRGEVVVINVWASWCPPCRAEAPGLERVYRQTRSHGVTFVGLNVRDRDQNARSAERTFGTTYPSVVDHDQRLLLGFRDTVLPSAVPSTVVIDRRGRVATAISGPASPATLRDLVDEVVDEKKA